ncbi:hypothetical protein PRZ61_12245 [Halomonas pacifica]|uniref:hypothetical protein n=1 Tax=Bisbaumannia pacifica TaxID=77098 RepID=UPI002359E1BF|nr:hypothetical protein [Halomonas pacifica]MDC8804212.1 hypothetical protein [Halomonas pacifica]
MSEPTPDYTPAPPLTLGGGRAFYMPMTVEATTADGNSVCYGFDLRVLDVGRTAWRDMMLELDERMADPNTSEDEKEEQVAELLLRVVIGWRFVIDDNGALVPFGGQTFRQLLNIQGMAQAIIHAYGTSCPQALAGEA